MYRGAIERGGGPALELGCGNGRLLVRYRIAGLDVEGVDSSADMLAICRAHADAAGLSVTLHCADWTTFDLPRRYATIYNPAGSFMLIARRRQAARARLDVAASPRAGRAALDRDGHPARRLRRAVGVAGAPQRDPCERRRHLHGARGAHAATSTRRSSTC